MAHAAILLPIPQRCTVCSAWDSRVGATQDHAAGNAVAVTAAGNVAQGQSSFRWAFRSLFQVRTSVALRHVEASMQSDRRHHPAAHTP